MAAIFPQNGILSGHLDYYCLICSEKFTTEDATLAHIIDLTHKDKLKTCGYVENHKKDFIRKDKGINFCEPCSLTFPTAPKVELHIDESHLNQRKKKNPLNRLKNEIIAFNQFIISNDAWNGCIEDTCVLCNTEFDDSASHKTIQSHVLNLIKSEVFFDESNHTIYRTIDDRSKQCITCNVIIGNDTASHFATAEHTEAYKLYDPTIQQDETEKTIQTPTETRNGKPNNDETGKNEAIKVFNRDINNKARTNANKDEKINTNKNDQEDVKKEVKTTDKNDKKDAKKEGSNPLDKAKVKQTLKRSANKGNAEELGKIYCKNLGAQNYVTSKDELGERWCVLCEWLLEESTEVHIRSKHHQELLKLHKERIAGNSNKTSSKDEGSIPYESVERYQKSNVNINLINETAFCRKCSKNVDFNTTAIDKHIEEHKMTPNKKSLETLSLGIKSNGTEKTTLYTKPVLLKDKRSPKKNVSIGDYAKQHGFSHNVADCSYYCRPCSRRLNPTLEELQKHVASKIHMEYTKQSSKNDTNKAPVKEPLLNCIQIFDMVETMNQGRIIHINDKYWLNSFSFFLIAKQNERFFCYGCQIDLTRADAFQHIGFSDYHRKMIEKCLLITSLGNEFIRELRPDVYHCGYCNITENNWDDMLDHLAMVEHKIQKGLAEESQRQYQPNLYKNFTPEQVDDVIKRYLRRNP